MHHEDDRTLDTEGNQCRCVLRIRRHTTTRSVRRVSGSLETALSDRTSPPCTAVNIWLFDLTRGSRSKLTFDPADETNPTWSPDGRQIAFTSDKKGSRDLYRKAASGSGQEELLLQSADDKSAEDWTRDGRYLLYNKRADAKRALWALPLAGDRKPFAVLNAPGTQPECQISPDGKWIAYRSDESGRQEIYVQNFPPAGGKWQVSTAGGVDPQWRRDGKEMFYRQGNRLMSVEVRTTDDRFERDLPRLLFELSAILRGRNQYTVSPDGQKFLAIVPMKASVSLPIAVLLDWQSQARR